MFKWLAVAAAVAIALPLGLLLLVTTQPAAGQARDALSAGPSLTALADIPPAYLARYERAAHTCPGLPWEVLAAIGKVESDHGRSTAPGVHSGANFAGAEGPMQFEPGTFAQYSAVAMPGRRQLSPYALDDAINTAAAMLCANGAASGTDAGIRQAIFTYNHSWAYVTRVLSWANRYATPAASGPAAMAIAFALRQVGKPYRWGATGPKGYDCSGLVYAAYAAAGIRIGRTTFEWRQDGPQVTLSQIQAGDLLFSAGSDGTPANPGHVVMYLGGGQVIQAPQAGEDVQIDPLDLAGIVAATRPSGLSRHT